MAIALRMIIRALSSYHARAHFSIGRQCGARFEREHMSDDLKEITFAVNGLDVHAFERNGKVFFDADEVMVRLGYQNPQAAIARHCKDGLDKSTVPGVSFITEPDFYRLVFRSRKPGAKAFVRWICHDVLPSIRKHGAYFTLAKLNKALHDPDAIIRLAQKLKAERQEQNRNGRLDHEQQEGWDKFLKVCRPDELRTIAEKIIRENDGNVIKQGDPQRIKPVNALSCPVAANGLRGGI